MSTVQGLCRRSYCEQDIPAPLQQSIQPPKSIVLKSRNPVPEPQSGLCGRTQQRRGKSLRQLTSPLYSLENNALGKERRRDGWEEASWTEITLGSQRDMHCNRLHSRWVSGREGMLCAFGVGTWDHEEMTIPMSPHRNRKCGFHWHRKCHFWRRHADGNKRHLRGYSHGPMTETQKRGWIA